MSDIIFWGCILIALYYVPRYLWRVYGGRPIGAMIVNGFSFVMSRFSRPSYADETDGRTDGRSVPQDDLYCPRLESDISKQAVIEVMLYNGWGTADIRSILKGSNETLGQEVEAARQRLGIEAPDNRTPIAGRSTPAKFASDAGH